MLLCSSFAQPGVQIASKPHHVHGLFKYEFSAFQAEVGRWQSLTA